MEVMVKSVAIFILIDWIAAEVTGANDLLHKP
jgi:hypothetical protein